MRVIVDFPPAAERIAASKRPLLFDCFTFFNELELLELRLNELAEVASFFVLAEAAVTFRGDPKPYVFLENRERFRPFLDRIIHVRVENFDAPGRHQPIKVPPSDLTWTREGAQRNALIEGLARARPTDWAMVSDLDEIPRAEMVASVLREPMYRRTALIFEHDFYINRLNWRVRGARAWTGAKLIERRFLRTTHGMRRLRHNASPKSLAPWLDWRAKTFWDLRAIVFPQRLPNAGWHFTSMGDAARIHRKLTSWAHWHEMEDPDAITLERIAARLEAGLPHVDKPVTVAPPRDLPRYVAENPDRFRGLLDDRPPGAVVNAPKAAAGGAGDDARSDADRPAAPSGAGASAGG